MILGRFTALFWIILVKTALAHSVTIPSSRCPFESFKDLHFRLLRETSNVHVLGVSLTICVFEDLGQFHHAGCRSRVSIDTIVPGHAVPYPLRLIPNSLFWLSLRMPRSVAERLSPSKFKPPLLIFGRNGSTATKMAMSRPQPRSYQESWFKSTA